MRKRNISFNFLSGNHEVPYALSSTVGEPKQWFAYSFAKYIQPVFADPWFWMGIGVRRIELHDKLELNKVNCAGIYTFDSKLIRLSVTGCRGDASSPAAVLCHEIGHGIDNMYSKKALEEVRSSPMRQGFLAWNRQWTSIYLNGNEVSNYARTDSGEDKAESFCWFLMNPEALKAKDPVRYELCERAIKVLMPNYEERLAFMLAAEEGMSDVEVSMHRIALWLNNIS